LEMWREPRRGDTTLASWHQVWNCSNRVRIVRGLGLRSEYWNLHVRDYPGLML
jgi:hypothetical protein